MLSGRSWQQVTEPGIIVARVAVAGDDANHQVTIIDSHGVDQPRRRVARTYGVGPLSPPEFVTAANARLLSSKATSKAAEHCEEAAKLCRDLGSLHSRERARLADPRLDGLPESRSSPPPRAPGESLRTVTGQPVGVELGNPGARPRGPNRARAADEFSPGRTSLTVVPTSVVAKAGATA
jgi:hypothetical protein